MKIKILKRIGLATGILLAIGFTGPTLTSDHIQPLIPEDIMLANAGAGESLASQCTQCHGRNGISTSPGVPHIAGQHAIYLARALDSYLDGFRLGMPMSEIVAGWSKSDIIDVAVHFSRLEPFAKMASISETKNLSVAATQAQAQTQTQKLIQMCTLCHGQDGNTSLPGTPSIAAQPAPYLVAALKAYREGTRVHAVMQAYTQALSNADIALMSSYYAAILPANKNQIAEGDQSAGAAATASCTGCHGIDGNTNNPSFPRLAGLNANYLATAMRAYRDGSRSHDLMQGAVKNLDDGAIEIIARFYASQKALLAEKPTRLSMEEWVLRCNRCHNADGDSDNPEIPILTGQSSDYLSMALRVYHSGTRQQSTMQAMAFLLAEDDFNKLASFYASKRRK